MAARHPVGQRQPVRPGLRRPAVGADRHRHQVGRHRVAVREPGDRPAVRDPAGGQPAGGDADPAARDVEADPVGRLVRRVVVDGVPREGAVRLLHRPRLAGAGGVPAQAVDVLAARRRVRGSRPAAVADAHGVRRTRHRRRDRHGEVTAAVRARRTQEPAGRGVTHRQPRHPEGTREVEPEGAVASRDEPEPGDADEGADRGAPPQGQPVVEDVEAGGADRRVDAVGLRGEVSGGCRRLDRDPPRPPCRARGPVRARQRGHGSHLMVGPRRVPAGGFERPAVGSGRSPFVVCSSTHLRRQEPP